MSEGIMMKRPNEFDLPHSEAGHNALWCGGDSNGGCCSDDSCWPCIEVLHHYALLATRMGNIKYFVDVDEQTGKIKRLSRRKITNNPDASQP